MLILAVETATSICAVALRRDDQLEIELHLDRPRAHAENLVPMVQDALRYGGADLADVDAVAVSMGPGSYTGLRIGVSTAKGLALAGGADLVGVPTLEALALGAGPTEPGELLVALLPSRRNEVYAAAFRAEDGALTPAVEAAALSVDDLPAWLGATGFERLRLLGPGAERVAPVLAKRDVPFAAVPLETVGPSARRVAQLGAQRLQAGRSADLRAFEPFYLKEFVAGKQRSAFEKLSF